MALQNNNSFRSNAVPIPENEGSHTARDRLLQKLRVAADLPALGRSVSRVVQLASSDDEAIRQLANLILSDVALTQTILRISNTVMYRTASAIPVTTISKAILLLGFDAVKTAALAMLVADGLPGKHGKSVRRELGHALGASIIAREMARHSHFKDAEEAAVAALFKNIGRVLVAAHEHDLYAHIMRLVESGSHTPTKAAMETIGCSFDLLARSVLQEWKIPETIVQALPPLPAGIVKPARGRQEWMQQVADFSAAAASLIPSMDEPGHEAAAADVLKRFGAALNVGQEMLDDLLATAAREVRVLIDHADLKLETVPTVTEAADRVSSSAGSALPAELLLDGAQEAGPPRVSARHPSGKPLNARDLLLAGLQDVTQLLACENWKVNDLMLMVLETLYSGLGFRFAAVCLKDVRTEQFRARIAIGEEATVLKAGFAFSATPSKDVFQLAMENNADLVVADATAPGIGELLPAWHRRLLPDARSFIVLPLVVNNKRLGLFYADRAQPAPEGVPPDERSLIKTLKGQVLTALNSR